MDKLKKDNMTEDDIKYRQGRSKKQVEKNETITFYATAGLFIVLVGMIVYGLLNG